MEMRVRNRTSQQQNERPLVRRGFTLVELLVAIVIISVLAAFLLPAIQGIVGTAKEGAVRSEISQLESAIATFKQKFGIEPPSGITLCEEGDNWDLPANATSKALIQRMWPNFNFSTDRILNGDGNTTSPDMNLKGSECLVFFLGGILDSSGNAPSGFSKNPENPFLVATVGEQREGPFFEFVPSRLIASPTTANAPAKVYLDPLGGQTAPYLYLSSYDGKGYQTADIPASTNLSGPYLTASGGAPHKQKTFQIISPGADTLYSLSGGSVIYDVSQSNNGLGTNIAAYDNITNFASGKLKP